VTTNPPTPSVGGHETWEQLAAGHALHALEPADEAMFLEHLGECPLCRAAVDDYSLVAAQLGSLAESEADEAPDWQHLRAGIISEPDTEAPVAAQVVDLDSRRRRGFRLLTAAAAALVVIGGAVVWRTAGRSSGTSHAAVAAITACEKQPGCRLIRLRTSAGVTPAAVVVDAERVSVVPLKMSTPPLGKTYVLWQMPRDGGPIAVAEFRDPDKQTAASALPAPYADTAAFAVSEEQSTTRPVRPTDVLAVGNAV
jgi:hypothetical protein